jgi:hypothetical protein
MILSWGRGRLFGERRNYRVLCLGCQLIETAPVALRDGRTVCNCCPDWKQECLVRDLAGRKTNGERKAFMDKFEAKHGAEMAKQLRGEVWAVMKETA